MNVSKELIAFECEACGECCRHIQIVPELAGFYDDEKGACKFLEDDKCTIYENRPDVCNYRKLYEKNYKHYSVEEYYNMSVTLCNEIKK